MKRIVLILTASIILFGCSAREKLNINEADLETLFEQSEGTKTPLYAETIEYCTKLDSLFSTIHYSPFGTLPGGREMPLLIYDKDGFTNHSETKGANKASILIFAAIHAGEPCGKDAGLMLMRDLALGKLGNIADSTTVLFVPILSPDGHEFFRAHNRINQKGPDSCGWRVNACNLNLNRDFLKTDTPEIQMLLSLADEWKPNFVVDCHSTDGTDYQYEVTYMMEIFGNMKDDVTAWQKDIFLPKMLDGVKEDGFNTFPYVSFRNWHDPKSGLYSGIAPPRLSHGYFSVRNIPSLLIETHARKEYKVRVYSNYSMLKHTIKLVNEERESLFKFRYDDYKYSEHNGKKYFHTNYKLTSDSTLIDFEGFKYYSKKSDLSGGDWYIYSDTPYVHKIWYYHNSVPADSCEIPEYYLIPPQWTKVIEKLNIHGIEYERLTDAETIEVNTYHFKNVKWGTKPYEGILNVKFDYDEVNAVQRTFPMNTVKVKANPIVMHLLEPSAPDNLVFWGYFNSIFEQKEYSESYIMEIVAREMFEKDPDLKIRFEEQIKNTPEEMSSPWEKLNWLYKQTPYWDWRINEYPVCKVMN